jgi:phage terminase Nu1 subunit (DNA packaging protein)
MSPRNSNEPPDAATSTASPKKAKAHPVAANSKISTAQAGGLIKVGAERVRQLSKLGWIKKVGRGKYRVVDVVHGYIDFLQDEQRRASKSASASRVQDARARQIELATARDENALIETTEAVEFVDDVIGRLRSGLSGIPARVTRDLDQRRKIETEIDAEFGRASAHFEQEAATLRAGGVPAEAAAADEAG